MQTRIDKLTESAVTIYAGGAKFLLAVCKALDDDGIDQNHPDRNYYLRTICSRLSMRGHKKKAAEKRRARRPQKPAGQTASTAQQSSFNFS